VAEFIKIDGLLVEVEAEEGGSKVVSRDNTNEIEDRDLGQIETTLGKVAKHIKASWNEINKDMSIKEATVEVSLGFEAEGNLFIAKGKTSSQLKVTFKLEPTEASNS